MDAAQTLDYVEKFPSGAAFQETKDRVLRTGKSMLGAYEYSEAKYNNCISNPYYSLAEREAGLGPVGSTVTGAPAASNSLTSISQRELSNLVGAREATMVDNTSFRDYSNMPFPRRVDKDTVDESAAAAAAAASQDVAAKDAQGRVKDGKEKEKDKAVPALPDKRSRGADKDKSEIKKRWTSVLSRCRTVLSKASFTVAPAPTSSSSSTAPSLSAKERSDRTTVEEAVEILDDAAALPTYINAPGEDFGETVRSALGEVLKSLVESRQWASSVRDALHRNMSAIRNSYEPNFIFCLNDVSNEHSNYFHFAQVQAAAFSAGGKSAGKRPSGIASFNEMKAILHEGENLRIAAPEEARLREHMQAAERAGKECRRLLGWYNKYLAEHISSDDNENADEDDEDDAPPVREKVEKNSIEYVNNLMKTHSKIPIYIKEMVPMTNMFQHLMKLQSSVIDVFERINVCSVRKPKGPISEGFRLDLEDIKELYDRCDAFPVSIPLLGALQEVLGSAEAWRVEVRRMGGLPPPGRDDDVAKGADKPVTTASGRSVKGVSRDFAAASIIGSNSKPASLKRVESLLAEGEKMPFNFSLELEVLREKRQQAKQWLEKLKSKFPKHGRVSSRVGVPSGAPGERISFADMKMMVQEGEELFDDESNRSSNARELSKAQSVIDVAEEWLSRVREAIADATAAYEESCLNPTLAEKKGGATKPKVAASKAKKVDDVKMEVKGEEDIGEAIQADEGVDAGEGDGEGAEEEPVDAISMLKELIAEADEMPISMEEAQVLRCHLSAIEWARKARPVLQLPLANGFNYSDGSSPDRIYNYSTVDSGAKVMVKPRLSEVKKLFNEITRIRATVPQAVWDDFRLKPLRDEAFCMESVSSAEQWLQSCKKYVVNNALKKGVKLADVLEILKSANNIHINFEYELKPFKTALLDAEKWISENRDQLLRLKISATNIGYKVVDGEIVDFNDGEADSQIEESAQMTEKLTFSELFTLCNSAKEIDSDFPALASAKAKLVAAEKFVVGVNEKLANNFKKSGKKPRRSSRAELEALLDKASDFDIDLEVEKEKLESMLEKGRAWNDATLAKIDAIMQTQLAAELTKYKQGVVSGCFSPTNSSPFAVFRGLLPFADENGDNDYDVENSWLILPAGDGAPESSFGQLEDSLYEGLQGVKQSLMALQAEGFSFVVEEKAAVLLDACLACFRWMDEIRQMCLLNSSKNGDVPITYNGVENWGDVSSDYLRFMLSDAIGLTNDNAADDWRRYDKDFQGCILQRLCPHLEANAVKQVPLSKITISNVKKQKTADGEPNDDNGDSTAASVKSNARSKSKQSVDVRQEEDKAASKGGSSKRKRQEEPSAAAAASNSKKGGSKAVPKSVASSKDRAAEEDSGEAVDGAEGADVDMSSSQPSAEAATPTVDDDADTLFDRVLLSYYAKKLVKHGVAVGSAMEEALDLFGRLVLAMISRLNEGDQWTAYVKKLLAKSEAASPGSQNRQILVEVNNYLLWAKSRGIELTQMKILLVHKKQHDDLIARVAKIRNQDKTANFEDFEQMRDYVKVCDKLLIDCPEIAEFKAEFKKVKNWVQKYKSSGIDSTNASTAQDEVNELCAEAAQLPCNLSVYTDAITASTQLYCLCRGTYYGNMIGCDYCEEWYHITCLAMAKGIADKLDNYMCCRCATAKTFSNICKSIAEVTNKWMRPEEIFKIKQANKIKLARKRSKEEKDLANFEVVIRELQHRIAKHTAIINFLTGVTPELQFESLSVQDIDAAKADNPQYLEQLQQAVESNEHQLQMAIREVGGISVRLQSSRAEEGAYLALCDDELLKLDMVVDWMKVIQRLIYADDEIIAGVGAPLGPDSMTNNSYAEVIDCLTYSPDPFYSLLSSHMRLIVSNAREKTIDSVGDVSFVITCFKWLSWLSIYNHYLRAPATTGVLQRLYDSGRTLKTIDPQTKTALTFLNNNLLTRAKAWKVKCRTSLVKAGARTIEGIAPVKLTGLVLEASMLPFASSLKSLVRQTYEKEVQEATKRGGRDNIPVDASTDADDESNAGITKKNQRTAVLMATGLPSSINLLCSPDDLSDDDEENFLRGKHQNVISWNLPRSPSLKLQDVDPSNWAPPTVLTWPPALTLPRVEHKDGATSAASDTMPWAVAPLAELAAGAAGGAVKRKNDEGEGEGEGGEAKKSKTENDNGIVNEDASGSN